MDKAEVLDGRYTFKILSNPQAAPELRLVSTLQVLKSNNKKCNGDENTAAVILHHTVNCNKWGTSRGGKKEEIDRINNVFWSFMPPVRKQDRQILKPMIPDEAIAACKQKIDSVVHDRTKYAQELGIWTQVGCFNTMDQSGNTTRKFADQPTAVAPMAVVQVNDKNYRGEILLDGRLSGLKDGALKRSILASMREHDATEDEIRDFIVFLRTLELNYVENGEKWTPFAMDTSN